MIEPHEGVFNSLGIERQGTEPDLRERAPLFLPQEANEAPIQEGEPAVGG